MPARGWFVAPTVFADVDPDSELAQEEIFGPFLSILRARSLAEAVELANGVEYALTGAAFTRDPEELDYIRAHFHVGNLYFNRKCTAAIVGAHPFGRFQLSGTDATTGSPE